MFPLGLEVAPFHFVHSFLCCGVFTLMGRQGCHQLIFFFFARGVWCDSESKQVNCPPPQLIASVNTKEFVGLFPSGDFKVSIKIPYLVELAIMAFSISFLLSWVNVFFLTISWRFCPFSTVYFRRLVDYYLTVCSWIYFRVLCYYSVGLYVYLDTVFQYNSKPKAIHII